MSNLQKNLTIVQNTVSNLASAINELSIASGHGEVIDCNTQFSDYPEIIRSLASISTGSLITVFAYKISDIDPGVPEDKGDFDFNTNTFTAPNGGCKQNDINANESDTIWMSQAIFAKKNNESVIVDGGSKPIRLSNFTNLKTPSESQTVYLVTDENNIINYPVGTEQQALNDESIKNGGSESYQGITKDRPYAFISTRTKKSTKGSSYSKPVLFAYYAQDGSDGASVLINRTAFAFKATSSRNNSPDRPVGGKGDIDYNDIILPDGGFENPSTDEHNKYIGMSNAVFSTDVLENPEGSTPICITGEDGVDGTDGQNSEFIYALFKTKEEADFFKIYLLNNGYSLEISQTDVVPNFILNGQKLGTSLLINSGALSFNVQLTDSPVGISDEMKIELYGTRTKSATGGSNGVGPMYGSMWGENGMDGDGVEYIFSASSDNSCDTPIPIYADLLKNNPEEAEKFQQKEYTPDGGFDNDDDGGEVGPTLPYLFCSSRKQYFDEKLQKQMWGDFSKPKIGSHGGKDGKGSYTSFAFCISKEDLSKYSVSGGYYGDSLKSLITKNDHGSTITGEWFDSIPKTPSFDESIWMINKFFNNSEGEYDKEGFGPVKMVDTENFQVEFNCPIDGDDKSAYDGRDLISLQTFKELKESENIIYNSNDDLELAWRKYVYDNGYGLGNDGKSGAVYMATARFVNNKGEEGSVNKIQGESGNTNQFIFKLSKGNSKPENPSPIDTGGIFQSDSFKPDGGEFNPQLVSETYPVCWVSKRDKKDGVGSKYSDPTQGSMYAKGNVHLELSEDQVNIPCENDGRIDPDYNSHIVIDLLLYDNGILVNGKYSALINDDDDDYVIDRILDSVPASSDKTGFLGNKLYIGRDFLSRYVNDYQLRVECQAKYSSDGDYDNGTPYSKTCLINKLTNVYELIVSHDILHLNKNGYFKDSMLTVQAVKGVENQFKTDAGGYIEYIINYIDKDPDTKISTIDPGGMEYIYLSGYKNVSSIVINYKLNSNSEILATEQIGVIKDPDDAVSKFLSQVFCRTNDDISSSLYAPIGGTYDNPIPDKGAIDGSDGIPEYDNFNPKQLWMSQKGFSSDGSDGAGSNPILMQDTNDLDIWWCDNELLTHRDPGNPPGLINPGGYDGDSSTGNNMTIDPKGMAVRHHINGSWTDGIVTRVKGEKGEKGDRGEKGESGDLGDAKFKSYVFTGAKDRPSQPTGGDFDNPIPDDVNSLNEKIWSDYVKEQPSKEHLLGCSSAGFESDNYPIHNGSIPQIMADSSDFDVEFSSEENPSDPIGHPNTNSQWTNVADETTIGMATSKLSQGKWSDGTKAKIKGEKGQDGTSIKIQGSFISEEDFIKKGKDTNGNGIAPDDLSETYVVEGNLGVWDGDSGENVGQFKGEPGKNGQPGSSAYLHIKYANKSNNSVDSFNVVIGDESVNLMLTDKDGETPGDYIGTFTDDISGDPNRWDSRFNEYKGKYGRGNDGYGYEYIYILTKEEIAPDVPVEYKDESDFVPNTSYNPDGTDSPSGVNSEYKYEGMAHRLKTDKWGIGEGSASDKTKAVLGAKYGEQGPQGPPGPKGDNGGFGPMARYSVGGEDSGFTKYYDRDTASSEKYKGYDIVEYRGDYYLCIDSHDVSDSINPLQDSVHWEKSSHFDFLTANDAAIENLVSKRIEAEKLVTNSSGENPTRINIHDGQINIYGSTNHIINAGPSIKIGIDQNGNAVLEFGDSGAKLYDLGPLGLRDFSQTVNNYEKGVAIMYNLLDTNSISSSNIDVVIDELKNRMSDSSISYSKTLYRYDHYSILEGSSEVESLENDGNLSTKSNSITDWFTGYIFEYAPTSKDASDAVYNVTEGSEIHSELVEKIEEFNSKYGGTVDVTGSSDIYRNSITYFKDGKKQTSVELFFNL